MGMTLASAAPGSMSISTQPYVPTADTYINPINNATGMTIAGAPGAAPATDPSAVGNGTGNVLLQGASTRPSAAQTDPILAMLATLDTVQANKDAQAKAEWQKANDSYDAYDALDKQGFDQNTQQNESTYTGNNHNALLSATNGATGLRGVLGSLGALSGSGIDVIRRLVGLALNQDSGAARQSFDTNAKALGTAWDATTQAEKQRRADADSILQNTQQNNKASVLTSRQNAYKSLADMYGPTDATGLDYASKAAALAGPIADTTVASVAPYAKGANLFSPGAMRQYLAGTQNLNVNTSGAGSNAPINSPAYGSTKKQDQLTGVA